MDALASWGSIVAGVILNLLEGKGFIELLQGILNGLGIISDCRCLGTGKLPKGVD
jgi:hypothetical protein